MESKIHKIKIVGIFPSAAYQKCKCYALCLNENLPNIFAEPSFRPMLDIQWLEFITKCRRIIGGPFWKFTSHVTVFIDGKFFGNEDEFEKFCNKNFRFRKFEDFAKIGKVELANFVKNSERIFVYFIMSINEDLIGTLLFELFIDLVPLTCSNFLRQINSRRGYKKALVNRVLPNAWIQFGHKKLRRHQIPCENYFIEHDRRGVLSMCNSGKHRHNSTHFFVSLQKSHWMDCYYVAFGQLIHGEGVLNKIETVKTRYESPLVAIRVEDCGEYKMDMKPDKKIINAYETYLKQLKAKDQDKIYPEDIADYRDVESVLSDRQMQQGYYSVDVDVDSDINWLKDDDDDDNDTL